MDWAKAKNILIIALVITNLFLGYYVLKDWRTGNHSYSISQEKINDVKEILKQKNIIVNAHVPQEIFELPELTFEYETYNIEEIEEKIFKDNKRDSRESIKVSLNNKFILYTKKTTTVTADKEPTEESAKEIAYDFIKKIGFNNDEAEFWQIKETNKEYTIEYKQKYESIVFDDGYMKVKVKNNEVVRFERKWLKPIDTKTINKRVIPATKALLLAMDELKEKKDKEDSAVIVTDINLVYSLNNPFLDEEWYEGNEKEGFPYWRIRLENEEDINIEAQAYE